MELALRHSGKRATALAQYLGISESAISQWVNGPTKSVNSVLVIKAAHFLGVSAFWFSTGEGDMLQTAAINEPAANYSTMTDAENKLLEDYRQLSSEQQVKVSQFTRDLVTA